LSVGVDRVDTERVGTGEMDIQRVNHVIEKAIIFLQEEESEALFELEVPSPADVAKRYGLKSPKPRKQKKQPEASVEFWNLYLSGKLVAYDRKESAKEMKRGGMGNIYRMGHLLKAAQKVEAETKSFAQSSSSEDIEKFRKSMNRNFHSTFPPIKAVNKAIDRYYTTGKRPKYGK